MIIFTPERTSQRQNPCFFHILSEIAKQHDLKFLPNVTHPNRDWTKESADQVLSDPNSVIEFKDWAHIDLFKHSTRKKIILLDQFEPHDFYKYLINGVIYPLDPDNYYPRPRLHAPSPAIDRYPDCIDYSWADLIIGIQEECLVGPQWIEYFNNPGAYFHTHPDRVITIVAGANSDISYQNVFPPNVLRVPLNMWCSWVTACNTPVEYQPEYDRPYKFEALLGGSKENRQFVYRKLKNHGLLEQGLLSISAQTFRAPTDRVYHDDYYRSPALDVFDTETMLTLRATTRKHNWVAHTTGCPELNEFPLGNGQFTSHVKPFISFFIPHRVYQESWFTILAESIVRHCDFYTEKTAKALLGRRIFITFGPQYSLKVLRDNGFKTFGNWIDESYDDEPDDEIRWNRAFEQVVRLINHPSLKSMYAEAQAVIEHNYQLVSDQRYLLKPIDDFIQSHLNGTARSQIGLAPMRQNWTPAQKITSDKNHQPVRVEYTSESATHAPSFYPPVSFGLNIIAFDSTTISQPVSTTVAQPVSTTVAQPVVTTVPQSTRRFNDPAVLEALELARAETAKRRPGVGSSLQGLELARAETARRRQQLDR